MENNWYHDTTYLNRESLRDEPAARTAAAPPADTTGRALHPDAPGRPRTRTLSRVLPLIILISLLIILDAAGVDGVSLGTSPAEVRDAISTALKRRSSEKGTSESGHMTVVSSLLQFNGQATNEQVDNNKVDPLLLDKVILETAGREAIPREALEAIELVRLGPKFASAANRGQRIATLSQARYSFGVAYKNTTTICAYLNHSVRQALADDLYACVRDSHLHDVVFLTQLTTRVTDGHENGAEDDTVEDDDYLAAELARQAVATSALGHDAKIKTPNEPADFEPPMVLETEHSLESFTKTAGSATTRPALPVLVSAELLNAVNESRAAFASNAAGAQEVTAVPTNTDARKALGEALTIDKSYNEIKARYPDVDFPALPSGVTKAEMNAVHLPSRTGTRSGSQPIVVSLQGLLSNYHIGNFEKYLETMTILDDSTNRLLADATNHLRNALSLEEAFISADEARRAHKARSEHFQAVNEQLNDSLEQLRKESRVRASGYVRDTKQDAIRPTVSVLENITAVNNGFRAWRREANDLMHTGEGPSHFGTGTLSLSDLPMELQIALLDVYSQLRCLDVEVKAIMPIDPMLLAEIEAQLKNVMNDLQRGPLERALGLVSLPLLRLTAMCRVLAPCARTVGENTLRQGIDNVPSTGANNMLSLTILVTQLQHYVKECKRYKTPPNVHAVLTVVVSAFVQAGYVGCSYMTDLKKVITDTSVLLNSSQDDSDAAYAGQDGLALLRGVMSALVAESTAIFAFRQAQSTTTTPPSPSLGVNFTSNPAAASPGSRAAQPLRAPAAGGGGGGGGGGGKRAGRSGRQDHLSAPVAPSQGDHGLYPNDTAKGYVKDKICASSIRYAYPVDGGAVCCINHFNGSCDYGGHPVDATSKFLAAHPKALDQFWLHMSSTDHSYQIDGTAAARLGIYYDSLSAAMKVANPDLPAAPGGTKIMPTDAEIAELNSSAQPGGRGRGRSRSRSKSRVSFAPAPSSAAAPPLVAPAAAAWSGGGTAAINAVASAVPTPQSAVPVTTSEPDVYANEVTDVLMIELGGVLESKFTTERVAECMRKIESGFQKDPDGQRACVISMLRRHGGM